ESEVVCYETLEQQKQSLMLAQSVDNALVPTLPRLQQYHTELGYLKQPGMFCDKCFPSLENSIVGR
ncbi:hypothetical protein MKW98_010557, partial [Papaver atlanticum]